MKQILALCLIFTLAFACSSGQDKNPPVEKAAIVSNKTITLAVEGMTCSGCENTIKEAVGGLEGVTEVTASHTSGSAIVKFDSTLTDFKAITTAISEAGYEVKGEKTPQGQPATN